jgi:hypothetical protein
VVGFAPRENASYLVFPKSISYPAETKIVGIKYDRLTSSAKGPLFKPKPVAKPGIPMREKRRFVLEEEKADPAAANKEPEAKRKRQEPARRRVKVKTQSFSATVVLTAVQKVKISVEADNSAAAQKMLRKEAEQLELDPGKAKITREIKKG